MPGHREPIIRRDGGLVVYEGPHGAHEGPGDWLTGRQFPVALFPGSALIEDLVARQSDQI